MSLYFIFVVMCTDCTDEKSIFLDYGMLKKLLRKLADCEQTCNHGLLHSTFNIVILILGLLYFRHPNSVTDRKYSRC